MLNMYLLILVSYSDNIGIIFYWMIQYTHEKTWYEFFSDFKKYAPARATYQVAKLPMGAAVEIEAIALSGELVVSEAGPCPCTRA